MLLAFAAFAAADDYKLPVTMKKQGPEVVAAAAIFAKPRVGLRVGIGNWRETMLNGGIDITFNVPVIPLPALRFDAEAWSRPDDLGGNLRGNAVSLLGIQTFTLVYAGLGPTYWFTSDHGDHRSGFGAKLLAGVNFRNFYLEGSALVGPSPVPVFISAGIRF